MLPILFCGALHRLLGFAAAASGFAAGSPPVQVLREFGRDSILELTRMYYIIYEKPAIINDTILHHVMLMMILPGFHDGIAQAVGL